jgi:hypothetical protein
MLPFLHPLLEFGPVAFFYLLALAATVSGYNNPRLAIILACLGTIWLCASVIHMWRKGKINLGKIGVEPSHLITIGLVGTFLFSSVGLAGIIWQQYRPALVEVHDLPNDMARRLVASLQNLKAFLPSVAIAVTNGDPETEQRAYALRGAFNRAGIETNFGFTVPDGPDDTGLLICLKDPEHPPPEAALLSAALKQAGLETKTRPFTRNGMHVSGESRDWQMVLWVAPAPL